MLFEEKICLLPQFWVPLVTLRSSESWEVQFQDRTETIITKSV